ncbi:hypothetical protein [Noviherbaspirillum sp. ST9]|uniref:hypothetical protein n=1 Tax=Noviherbaspirillum sp. ST9 TaxID=3401606 RepID=UPI003B589073
MSRTLVNVARGAACAALLAALQIPCHAQLTGAASPSTGGTLVPGPVVPPLIILAPTEVRTDPTLARGCWVRLFPSTGYKGADDLMIAGPIAISSLHAPTGGASGVYWKSKAESIIVGPRATVTVHENQDFRGPKATLRPGEREPELRNKLKMPQSIDSLSIECGQG